VVNGTPLTDVEQLPRALELSAAAPNPFHARTAFRFGLPVASAVDLAVFDVQGRLVRPLVSGEYPAGRHASTWDGLDRRGRPAPAGVYWCRLTTAQGRIERRIVRL
jgi:flagellar hook assembly protein FlgD